MHDIAAEVALYYYIACIHYTISYTVLLVLVLHQTLSIYEECV